MMVAIATQAELVEAVVSSVAYEFCTVPCLLHLRTLSACAAAEVPSAFPPLFHFALVPFAVLLSVQSVRNLALPCSAVRFTSLSPIGASLMLSILVCVISL